MSTHTAGLSLLLMVVVTSGAPAQGPSPLDFARGDPQALEGSMDGVWRSQGYGNVFEIHGASSKAFEVTNTTCVAGGTAAVDTTPVPGRIATLRTSGGGEMFVRAGGSADHKLLHSEGSASDERIDRIPRQGGRLRGGPGGARSRPRRHLLPIAHSGRS